MVIKNIKQPHGGALQHWEKGESGNPKGRPKKGIYLINYKLREMGYDPARREDIEETYMQLIQLNKPELVKLGKDNAQPMLIRLIAKNLLSSKGFETAEKILDRGIGKATQKTETKTTITDYTFTSNLNEPSKPKDVKTKPHDKKGKKTKPTKGKPKK